MAKRSITIRLAEKDQKLDIGTLVTALQDTVAVLKAIDQAVTGKRTPVLRWYIRHMHMHSPLEAMLECERAKPRKEDDGPPPNVITPFFRALRQIEKKASTPRYFSESELTRVKRIADLQTNGVSFIEFSSRTEDAVRPSARSAAHIASILGGEPVRQYHQFAELEGRLEDISLHPEVPQFAIYDPLTDQPIACEFDEKSLDQVTSLLKRRARVSVSGIAQFNSRHIPVSISVTSLEALEQQEELPQIDDVRAAGIDLTGGDDPVDVVRGLRDGR